MQKNCLAVSNEYDFGVDVAGPDTSPALLSLGFDVWEGINSLGATTHGVRHLYSSLKQPVHICQLNNFEKTLALQGLQW